MDGSINGGKGDGNWTVRKTGTGRYMVTVTTPGARIIAAHGNPIGATTAVTVTPVGQLTPEIEFWTTNTGATNLDWGFNFTILGFLP